MMICDNNKITKKEAVAISYQLYVAGKESAAAGELPYLFLSPAAENILMNVYPGSGVDFSMWYKGYDDEIKRNKGEKND